MIEVILAIICTEALTELIVHSKILEPLRILAERREFTANLVSCGYCVSVWTAFLWTILLIPSSPLYAIVWTLAVHRGANFLNDFADRYLREPFAAADKFFENHE